MGEAGTDVIRALVEAFSRRDVEAALELLDPEVIWEPASTEIAERRPYRGHAGMRDYFRDIEATWDRLEVTVHEVREAGAFVVVFGRIYAAGHGYVADDPASFVWRMAGDRVVWGKVFRDRAEALAAAGLVSA